MEIKKTAEAAVKEATVPLLAKIDGQNARIDVLEKSIDTRDRELNDLKFWNAIGWGAAGVASAATVVLSIIVSIRR
jgi:hypothetical protein